MSKIKCTIDFHKISMTEELLCCIQRLYKAKPGDDVRIEIVLSQYINPELLVIVVGIINYIDILIDGEAEVIVDDPHDNTYVQRINFLKEIGIKCEEEFCRHSSEGRFLEITRFTEDNNSDVVNSIMSILKSRVCVNSEVLKCLNYCLFEVVDNVRNHAESPIDGYVVVQTFLASGELIISIVDAGKGIRESLREKEEYSTIDTPTALEVCIQKGITNGKGMGNGLFHTANFIRENGGELRIYSDEYRLKVNRKGSETIKSFYWQGTLLCVKIKVNNEVSLKEIFGETIPITVEEFDECISGLW